MDEGGSILLWDDQVLFKILLCHHAFNPLLHESGEGQFKAEPLTWVRQRREIDEGLLYSFVIASPLSVSGSRRNRGSSGKLVVGQGTNYGGEMVPYSFCCHYLTPIDFFSAKNQ